MEAETEYIVVAGEGRFKKIRDAQSLVLLA